MKTRFKWLRRLTLRDWGWINFKIALGVLFPLFVLVSPPSALNATFSVVVYAWLATTFIGGLTSTTGIIMSAQPGRVGVIGLTVELAGLIFMFAGPFLLLVVYLALWLARVEVRMTAVGLTWSLCAALLARAAIIVPVYVREAHDTSKEV